MCANYGDMDKPARNRARPKNEAAQEHQREAAREAAGEILQVEDFGAFTDMIERRPELLGEMVIEELRRVAQRPGYGPLIALFLDLLAGARSDPRMA